MDLKRRVISGLGWTAGAKFLSQLIAWSITIIVMRLLSPEDYGLMAMAVVFIAFLALLNELGLGAALIQKQEIEETTLRQTFGMLLMVNFCLFLILLLVAPLVGVFFNEQRVIPIIRVLSIQFIMMPFAVIPQSRLAREMNFKKMSVVDFISVLSGSGVTLLLAVNAWGVWSLVWGSMAIILSRTIGLNVVSRFVHTPIFSIKGMAHTITFGGYVTITNILWFFYTKADIFIIGKLLGKEMLGLYSVTMNLSSLPMEKTSGIINQVAFPAFSSIQNEPEKIGSHFLKAVRIMSLVAFPILWGMSSVAPELVATLLGEKWHLAALPFQLLSLVIPIRMISNLMSSPLLGVGRPDISFFNVLSASLVMPLCILIATYWGIVGVSVAWIFVFPLIFLFNLSRVAPVLRVRWSEVLAAMARPALGAAIMYIIIMLIKVNFRHDANSIPNLLLLIVVGIMVYGGVMMSMNRQGYREILKLMPQK